MSLFQPIEGLQTPVVFTLIPINERAKETVVNHPKNRRLASLIHRVNKQTHLSEEVWGLNISLEMETKSEYTLATLGRLGDIVIDDPFVSRLHCSFEIHKDTKEILLYDRSSSWSTQTFGTNAVPFEPGRPARRVAVAKDVNTHFGLGGVK